MSERLVYYSGTYIHGGLGRRTRGHYVETCTCISHELVSCIIIGNATNHLCERYSQNGCGLIIHS